MDKVFALVDCNNFFVSCERVFKPELNHCPVVVLSSKDGCIVARSNETKKLGIPMGAPYFKWKNLFEKNGGRAFSSNFQLYGDMSRRIMSVLKELAPSVEQYSVDEAFLRLENLSSHDLNSYSLDLCRKVQQWIGIPISIGLAPTRTLAKIANHMAKKYSKNGVFDINSQEMRECVLASVAIEEVWGISHKWGARIRRMGIKTALDLSQADLKNIRKSLGVIGEKIALELRGVPCIDIRHASHKKTIISSRSFEKTMQNVDLIEESVANHISRAALRLRKQECVAGGMVVSLRTNRFSNYDKQYKNEYRLVLDSPTDATNILIAKSKECIQNIFKNGFKYKKTGIMLFDIKSKDYQQRSFFEEKNVTVKNDILMKLMDSMNAKQGSNSLNFAAQRISGAGKRRGDLHSLNKSHKLPLVN
jgi:DNA polymerase V